MTRAIFTSSCGDPFILLFALKMFRERWYDEADRYYVNINNHCGIPQEAIAELLSKVSLDPKVHIVYHPKGIGNGPPLTELTLIAKEDLISLVEDDAFIFEPGVVNRCFQQIESDLVDIVGSPRGSCGPEIWEASATKYGLDYTGYGDVGPNWWPNFIFLKRADLLKTDLNFGSITFKPGEYCKELDYTFKEINHGDTFVWACMQLRALGLRSITVPQHHASPFEIDEKNNNSMNWIGDKPKWIHGGSLSAGWGGYLSGIMPDVSNESAMQEMETRVAFWTICSDEIDGFDGFKKQYKEGIEKLIEGCQLDRSRIRKKITIYRELMRI